MNPPILQNTSSIVSKLNLTFNVYDYNHLKVSTTDLISIFSSGFCMRVQHSTSERKWASRGRSYFLSESARCAILRFLISSLISSTTCKLKINLQYNKNCFNQSRLYLFIFGIDYINGYKCWKKRTLSLLGYLPQHIFLHENIWCITQITQLWLNTLLLERNRELYSKTAEIKDSKCCNIFIQNN